MDFEFLIKSIIGLIVVLTLLIIAFILPTRSKKKKNQVEKSANEVVVEEKEDVLPFDELRAIVQHNASTTEDLQKAVDQIVEHYSEIQPKMGIRPHPDFDKYVDLIVYLVRHKSTNKDLILKLDRALVKSNPDYKAELNDTLTKALRSRGILEKITVIE